MTKNKQINFIPTDEKNPLSFKPVKGKPIKSKLIRGKGAK